MDVLRAAYVTLPGSLIHPIAMIAIIGCWIYTLVLGLRATKYHRDRALSTSLLPDSPRPARAPTGKIHHKISAGLLFATAVVMFAGMLNTYLRAGKLFPGPHMYGGFYVLLALSFQAATVPWFSDVPKARIAHLVGAAVSAILLLSQVFSGIPVLLSLIASFS